MDDEDFVEEDDIIIDDSEEKGRMSLRPRTEKDLFGLKKKKQRK